MKISWTIGILLAAGTTQISSCVHEDVAGDVTTYTFTTMHLLASVSAAFALLALGAWGIFLANDEGWQAWVKRGRWYATFIGAILLVGLPVMHFRQYARVTPEGIETVSTAFGSEQKVRFADVVRIEKIEERRRRSTVHSTVFHLASGEQVKLSSNMLLDAAIERAVREHEQRQTSARQQARVDAIAERAVARASAERGRQPVVPDRAVAGATAPKPIASDPEMPQTAAGGTTTPDQLQSGGNSSSAQTDIAAQHAAAVAAMRARAGLPVGEELRPPVANPSPTSQQVTASTSLDVDMLVEAQRLGRYFQARIVELTADGNVKVHYLGWPNASDEIVTRDRLWVEPDAMAKRDAPGDESPPGASTAVDVEPARAASSPAGSRRVGRAQAMRTWTDITGKHRVEARLVEYVDGKVSLERADGKRVTFPLEKLSVADQNLVRGAKATDSD